MPAPAPLGAFNPTAANIAAVAATSVWPAATTNALSQYPPQRDFTQANAYCTALGKGVCGPSTLGYGDARWTAGNGAFINGALRLLHGGSWRRPHDPVLTLSLASSSVFGIQKYDCKCVPTHHARAALRAGPAARQSSVGAARLWLCTPHPSRHAACTPPRPTPLCCPQGHLILRTADRKLGVAGGRTLAGKTDQWGRRTALGTGCTHATPTFFHFAHPLTPAARLPHPRCAFFEGQARKRALPCAARLGDLRTPSHRSQRLPR